MARKPKTAPIPVPNNRAELETLAEETAALVRAVERAKLDLDDKVSAAKADFKRTQAEAQDQIKRRMAVLAGYVAAHRGDLIAKDRKSFQLGAGTAGFRTSQGKLEIDDVEVTIITLEELGRSDVLRVVTEIDKDALKGDADLIGELPGVRVKQEEKFFFKPLDAADDIETTVPLKREAA